MTQRSPTAFKHLALLFFVLALACACGFTLLVFRSRAALSLPVPLQSGFTATREFHVPLTAHYRIELRCSRTIPFEQLRRALLRGNLVSISLSQRGGPVHLDYFPEASSATSGNLGDSQSWISQDIAVFAGASDQLYRLTYSVVRAPSELAVTEPTLFVALDPLEVEGRGCAGFLLGGTAVVFGFVSVVLWVLQFVRVRRARRMQRAEV